MKTYKKQLIITAFMLVFLAFTNRAGAQYLYLGMNGSAVASWFNTPNTDNLVVSNGWGWNLGAFVRYGKRPYIKAGFDWTRSINDFTIKYADEGNDFTDRIKFHEFDFTLKVGYNLLDLPMFKIDVSAGPFIGRSLFFSTDNIYFDENDFRNPQYGFTVGAGIQLTNFIAGIDYVYHITDMFTPIDLGEGESLNLGAHLQLLMVKVGFMF